MVSLLCGCCNKKKDFTFYIERVLFFRSNTENLNASIDEKYDKKDALFDCGFSGNSCIRDKRISSLFGLGFYFSAFFRRNLIRRTQHERFHRAFCGDRGDFRIGRFNGEYV